jgi:uncharacterized protein
MQISLRSVQTAEHGVELHESLALPRIAEENAQVKEIGPVRADVRAETSNHIFRVKGTLHTTVTYQCSRCLEHNSQALDAPFDESFTNQPSKVDEDIHFVPGDEIDLDPYIEETINLALEYCPVCDVDCKGLCPVCGCNRNRTTCNCDTRTIDPRLAALRDLLSSDESQ